MSQASSSQPAQVMRVVILGAGSSSSTPRMGCVAGPVHCKICTEAHLNPNSKNHRLNPSILIQFAPVGTAAAVEEGTEETDNASNQSQMVGHANATDYLNVLIDCGKTFRQSSLRHFPGLGVQTLHAVLLTHDHADACFGVDDLREFTGTKVPVPMPVYLDHRTDEVMRRVFGYLYPKKGKSDGRWVAALDWLTFEQGATFPVRLRAPAPVAKKSKKNNVSHDETPVADSTPAVVAMTDLTIPFMSMPIEHGPDYWSNGFIFDLSPTTVCVYFSDISRFDASDEERLKTAVGNKTIALLMMDMLSITQYFSHFSTDQALEAAIKIKAKCTYFVGMSHTVDYEKCNRLVEERLGKEGLVGHLAFDGCVVYDSTK
eukprot:GILI01015863.1.p1 GENE.GILI01015863.1~~GILI01015863.1.p1  ORF type:complete len:373 (+),score=47.02 GILI01015863.1:68-1186(+)